MAARIGETEFTSTNEAVSVISPMLVARPTSAVPMGSPMAMTEPNATSNTTTATRMPMISWPPGSSATASLGRSPPSSIRTAPVAPAASWVASSRAKASSRMPSEGRSYWTSTNPMRGSVGLVCSSETSPTWGWSATSSTAAATAAAAAGSASVVPVSASNTSWADVPAAAGKSASSVSYACWDSTPGMSNASEVSPPRAEATPRTATASTAQASRTRRRRRTAARPSR